MSTRDRPVAGPGVTRTFGAGKLSLMGVLAVCIAVVGAWAGIVPYVGAFFGFGMGDAPAWQWTTDRAILNLIPGAAAVLAALILSGSLLPLALGGGRALSAFAALLAMVAGAWLVLGPSALSAIIGPTGVPAPHGGAGWVFTQLVGYHLGPGILLAVLGAWVMGLLPRGGIRRHRPVLQ